MVKKKAQVLHSKDITVTEKISSLAIAWFFIDYLGFGQNLPIINLSQFFKTFEN